MVATVTLNTKHDIQKYIDDVSKTKRKEQEIEYSTIPSGKVDESKRVLWKDVLEDVLLVGIRCIDEIHLCHEGCADKLLAIMRQKDPQACIYI